MDVSLECKLYINGLIHLLGMSLLFSKFYLLFFEEFPQKLFLFLYLATMLNMKLCNCSIRVSECSIGVYRPLSQYLYDIVSYN